MDRLDVTSGSSSSFKGIVSYKPFGEYMYIKSMPVGLLAMADFLVKNGKSCEIVNLGVESIVDDQFDIIKYIKDSNAKVVAISLHWHYQSFDVIELAKKIKGGLPHIDIVLGGFNASFFAEEIMENKRFSNLVPGQAIVDDHLLRIHCGVGKDSGLLAFSTQRYFPDG